MPTFALKVIETVRGVQTFYQLSVDGNGQLDEYEKRLEQKYETAFDSLITLMNCVAQCMTLPREKFRDITPDKELVKEYEFKKGDLRVYAIQLIGGKIIVLGGFKNSQDKDIRKFRSLKKQYLESAKR